MSNNLSGRLKALDKLAGGKVNTRKYQDWAERFLAANRAGKVLTRSGRAVPFADWIDGLPDGLRETLQEITSGGKPIDLSA